MIQLYTWGTPNGRKVSIMLEELGLEYQAHQVNIGKGEQFNPDFLAIARGFGCKAEHVDTPEALTQAFKTAHKRDIPTLIEVQG